MMIRKFVFASVLPLKSSVVAFPKLITTLVLMDTGIGLGERLGLGETL